MYGEIGLVCEQFVNCKIILGFVFLWGYIVEQQNKVKSFNYTENSPKSQQGKPII